jgi:hypothetical protein
MIGADLVPPKERPMGSRVEHLEGVNEKSLPTGIMNCRSKHASEERTKE